LLTTEHSAAEPQPKKDVAGRGQYRFAVASGEFRDAENLMIIETHPTLPRIGTDLFQHYSEWECILSEETLSENKDIFTNSNKVDPSATFSLGGRNRLP
jgi:hypothetical protein